MSGLVDSYCDGCRYVTKGGGMPTCDYIGMTGTRRGCPAGDGCDKRERPEGWKPQRVLYTDEQWFRMQALKKAEEKAKRNICIEPRAPVRYIPAPKQEEAKPKAQKRESKKAETPKAPKPDAPKQEAPKQEAPKPKKKRTRSRETEREHNRRAEERAKARQPQRRELQRGIIRTWREREGLTQAQAAAKLDVSVVTLSRWESGRRKANWETLLLAGVEVPESILYADGI